MMLSLTITYILAAVVASIYFFQKWIYSYWERRGVKYMEPEFFYGNVRDMIQTKIFSGDLFKRFYDDLKSRKVKYGGIYAFFTPVFIPIDLDLIKSIMLKNFHHFVNRGGYVNEEADPLSGHLFSLEDEKWRNLRTKLTPTFTSGKLKMMFQTLVACTSGLEDILSEHSILQDAVDIKDVSARFTTDAIGSVAFGIDCNSLKNPDSEFRQWGKGIFEQSIIGKLRGILLMTLPNNFLHAIGFKVINRTTSDFLMNVVRKTVEYREENNVYRKDFMHLLLQLKNRSKVSDDANITKEEDKNKGSDTLTFNEVAAQCFVFFVAGFETSATTMTFALLELSLNQDIQDKLRQEINTVLKKHDMQFTYDSVMEMKYLEKVIDETLRKHSALAVLQRVCTKPYTIPGTDIVLEKGTAVNIPVLGIHRDPEYYPEPDKFDPERFNEENKARRHPFAYMPFGEGPRICIGARFGLLQTKVGIAAIIKNFKVTLNDKTKTPIRYSPSAAITGVDEEVWLNVTKIQ
ncbi:probable cytochrome P450 6a23 [Leptinotarsa decemlineata]|uniref:probable cytochrome P450 6a23 n=1 Tax=Leptinotarsa decemlineata TaxID=7539 RepID=UPI003D308EC5